MVNQVMEVNDPQVGMRIRRARMRAGMTQEQFVQKLLEAGEEYFPPRKVGGVASLHLSEIENGKRQPTVALLIAINRVLGCSLDEIIFGAPWRGLQSLTSRRCFVRPFDGPARNDFCAAIATRLGDDSDLLDGAQDALDDGYEFVDDISSRLRTTRKTAKLTQGEVAQKLTDMGYACSRITVARAEKRTDFDHTHLPGLKYISAFSLAVDASVDYLLLGRYASIDTEIGELFSWIPFEKHASAIEQMAKFSETR